MSQESNQQKPRSTPRKRKPRRRSAGAAFGFALIYVILVIGISGFLACVGWVLANDLLALNKESHSATIVITEEDNLGDLTDKLKENQLIEYPFFFKLFANVTGGDEDISRGTYTLNSDMDYAALLSGVSSSSATRSTVKVTFPEGYTIDQVFQLMEDEGVATVAELRETAANYDYGFSFLQDVIPLGDYHRLEGYLYPDTYEFYIPNDPKYAINKMLVNFDAQLTDALRDQIADSGYTIHEVVNIAAMIEKETDGHDRSAIASVIYNRLENPSYETMGCLQIDATIFYVTGREVTQNDRETLDSPYNTHINKGLPAGPIANPGFSSLMAAIEPDNDDYYYYALGDDGRHHFYKSYNGLVNFINSQERYQR